LGSVWWPTPLLGISLCAAGVLPCMPCATAVSPCHRCVHPLGFAALWEPVSSMLAAATGVGSSWDLPGGKLRQGTGWHAAPGHLWRWGSLGRCHPDGFVQEQSRKWSHTARAAPGWDPLRQW